MKVYVVTCTSFSPGYGDEGHHEHTSVSNVFLNEEKAKDFVKTNQAKKSSVWSSDYDYEEFDVEE